MDLDALYQMVLQYAPMPLQLGLMVLGSLVVAGGAYVAATPGKEDDAWWGSMESKPVLGHVLKLLVRFSPVQRKKK